MTNLLELIEFELAISKQRVSNPRVLNLGPAGVAFIIRDL